MDIETSEYINVRQKLGELGAQYPTDGIALLPLNIKEAASVSELKQASEAATIRKLLLHENIPVVDILSKEKRPPYIKNKSADWVAPIFFVSASVWNSNPNLLSVALNIVSSYVYDTLKGTAGTRTAKFSVVIEENEHGKSTRYDYVGPVEGLKDLPKAIKEAKT